MAKPHYLFITEKPSLKKNVEGVYRQIKAELPYTADFVTAHGHVIRLAKPDEYDPPLDNPPFFPKEYKYKVIEENRSFYKTISEHMKENSYDAMVNCCDPEREGQYIFWLIMTYTKCKLPQKRFWTNDQSFNAVVFALKNLRDNQSNQGILPTDPQFDNLTKSSILRGQDDFLKGMNYSKVLGCGAGRVRSAVLAMVVQRDWEIENFKETTYYEVDDTYAVENSFKATLQTVSEEEVIDKKTGSKSMEKVYSSTQFETLQEAEDFIGKELLPSATVISCQKSISKKKAPKLFKLSDVQAEANKAFGYNADKVLDICQELYEGCILSYPRTDCPYISTEMAKNFPVLLQSVACIPSLKPFVDQISPDSFQEVIKNKQYVNDAEIAESGHTALMPTDTMFDFEKLNKDQKNIITMIFKRFVAIFFPPVVEENTTVLLDNNKHIFKTTGKVTLDKGFLEVFKTSVTDKVLPPLKEGDVLKVSAHDTRGVTSKPPQHFTEGTLIQAMENPAKYLYDKSFKDTINRAKGIGTSATRANIIKKILASNQCTHLKGKGKAEYIVSTDEGKAIIKHLEGQNIIKVDLTAMVEERLSMVAKGKLSFEQYKKEMEDMVREETLKYQKLGKVSGGSNEPVGKCPFCGGVLVNGKFGIYCKNKFAEDENKKCLFAITDNTKEFLKKWHVKINDRTIRLIIEKQYLMSENGVVLTPYKNKDGYLSFEIDTSNQKNQSQYKDMSGKFGGKGKSAGKKNTGHLSGNKKKFSSKFS